MYRLTKTVVRSSNILGDQTENPLTLMGLPTVFKSLEEATIELSRYADNWEEAWSRRISKNGFLKVVRLADDNDFKLLARRHIYGTVDSVDIVILRIIEC